MKNLIIFLSAASGALAAFLIWQSETNRRRVPALAHQLEEAWGDHHTRV